MSDPRVRFALFAGVVLLYQFTYEYTQWVPQEGASSIPIHLVPVPSVAWFTAAWLLLVAGLLTLLSRAPAAGSHSEALMGRIAILAIALAYGVEVATRFFAGRLPVGLSPILAGGLLAAVVVVAVLLRWPPRTPVLVALTFAGGLIVRVAWLATRPIDPNYADNLAVIRDGLARFLSGSSPYQVYDYGTHAVSMGYLPFTFLAYLPAHLAGMDIRVTNLLLSALLPLALLGTFRALRLEPAVARRLALAAALLYALPIVIGQDADSQWQLFDLALVLVFCFLALGHGRRSAASFGLALGAMPVALYCAPPILVFLARTRPLRDAAALSGIGLVVAAAPIVAFVAWDARAFLSALWWLPLDVPGRFTIDFGPELEFSPALWHALPASALRLAQLALLVLLGVAAALGAPSVRVLVGLAAIGYVVLVLTGTYVASYMLTAGLYLAILAEAVASQRSAAVRISGAETPVRTPRRDPPPGTSG